MEKLYSGSVVVSQHDNGISYEVQLYVTSIGGSNRLTLSKTANGTAVTLGRLQDFARKLYTGVFTNDCMFVTDNDGNTLDVKFNADWSKVFNNSSIN